MIYEKTEKVNQFTEDKFHKNNMSEFSSAYDFIRNLLQYDKTS